MWYGFAFWIASPGFEKTCKVSVSVRFSFVFCSFLWKWNRLCIFIHGKNDNGFTLAFCYMSFYIIMFVHNIVSHIMQSFCHETTKKRVKVPNFVQQYHYSASDLTFHLFLNKWLHNMWNNVMNKNMKSKLNLHLKQ